MTTCHAASFSSASPVTKWTGRQFCKEHASEIAYSRKSNGVADDVQKGIVSKRFLAFTRKPNSASIMWFRFDLTYFRDAFAMVVGSMRGKLPLLRFRPMGGALAIPAISSNRLGVGKALSKKTAIGSLGFGADDLTAVWREACAVT